MSVIEMNNVIEGVGTGAIASVSGAPSVGTDAVQTITIGGTPTGGTFQLAFAGQITSAIPWNATNATLIASIDAALEALSTIGANGVVTAAGTLTAGIGTVVLTFSGGNLTKLFIPVVTVASNNMTGTTPTLTVANTTPGVTASARGTRVGGLLVDTTNAFLYQNTGTQLAPVWTKVGTES